MAAISFVVPGPPKGKGRPRAAVIAGRARMYTPAATRSEEGAIRLFARLAMAGRRPLQGAVELNVTAYFPIPRSWSKKKQKQAADDILRPTRKPDYDNVLKMCDALNGIVWNDDAQVATATVAKRYSAEPRLEISVEQS